MTLRWRTSEAKKDGHEDGGKEQDQPLPGRACLHQEEEENAGNDGPEIRPGEEEEGQHPHAEHRTPGRADSDDEDEASQENAGGERVIGAGGEIADEHALHSEEEGG